MSKNQEKEMVVSTIHLPKELIVKWKMKQLDEKGKANLSGFVRQQMRKYVFGEEENNGKNQ